MQMLYLMALAIAGTLESTYNYTPGALSPTDLERTDPRYRYLYIIEMFWIAHNRKISRGTIENTMNGF